MLFSERKRLREIEEREAAGESFWTEDIPAQARQKIALAWSHSTRRAGYGQGDKFREVMRTILMRNGYQPGFITTDPQALVTGSVVGQYLDHLEAAREAMTLCHLPTDVLDSSVNAAFNEHRVAFRFVEGEVVPLQSDELHVEVVEPTLRLLTDSRFSAAHASYLKALKEISANDPGDAITDAATALQETMVALGCDGNALGPLLKDAKRRGLLGSHDQTLIDGIGKFIDWVSSDRSTTGDAHSHSTAVLADAWLVVHVVGALIVRLADGTARGSR